MPARQCAAATLGTPTSQADGPQWEDRVRVAYRSVGVDDAAADAHERRNACPRTYCIEKRSSWLGRTSMKLGFGSPERRAVFAANVGWDDLS